MEIINIIDCTTALRKRNAFRALKVYRKRDGRNALMDSSRQHLDTAVRQVAYLTMNCETTCFAYAIAFP